MLCTMGQCCGQLKGQGNAATLKHGKILAKITLSVSASVFDQSWGQDPPLCAFPRIVPECRTKL